MVAGSRTPGTGSGPRSGPQLTTRNMKKAQKSTPKTPTKKAGHKAIVGRAVTGKTETAARLAEQCATAPLVRYRIEFSDGSAPREVSAAYPHVAEQSGRRMSQNFFRAVPLS